MNAEKLHALELSLTIGCRLDCLYCPQKLLLSRYFEEDKGREKKLSFENFIKVLEEVQQGAVISFCGMSEPFHNDRCADMICYAYDKGYKIALLTTLVGMTWEDFEKIKRVKFESFVLHIPDAEGHSHFEITEEYLKLLQAVDSSIDADYYSCHGTVHEVVRELIHKDKYAGISLGDRGGNLEGVPGVNRRSGKIVCYHGSEKEIGGWTPVMLPDGSLILCCQDYGMKHVLGNLIYQSWSEICTGEEYRKFRKGLEDDTLDILCRQCGDARKVETLPAMRLGQLARDKKESSEIIFSNESSFVQKLSKSKTVCVFGLGKLFRDHFFQEYWNEGLGVGLFSDNNRELHGKDIRGIICVEPEKLSLYDELLVVIFVKNGVEIKTQLEDMGVKNCFTIDEVLNEYRSVMGKEIKKLSL